MTGRLSGRSYTRRRWLKTVLRSMAVLAGAHFGAGPGRAASNGPSTLGFSEISHGLDADLHVPAGYRAEAILRWGDPLFPNAPPFNVTEQSAQKQLLQFGYNNDFIAYLPLHTAPGAQRGMLVVNNEFTHPQLMFPGGPKHKQLDKEQVDIEIAAHGVSVVELQQNGGHWQTILTSPRNRRITPWTEMRFSGPAAGHARLRSKRWPDGVHTQGTFGNCSGGVTPWGTVLCAEENIDFYFLGDASRTEEAQNYHRFGFTISRQRYAWGRFYDRWHLDREPRAGMHFGWIVEIDPSAPGSSPVKRTALGRFRHENCNLHVNADGRVVAYLGDDQHDEYIYRFVSAEKFDPANPRANRDLLDEGVLSVARFEPDGRLRWLPLVVGTGPLRKANGFNGPADVALDTRRAADLVGATKMDRPEEVEVNPVTGTVFAMLTGNPTRVLGQTDAANPRPFNLFGHILELTPPEGDHSADEYRWQTLLLAGDPDNALLGARYHPATSRNGWFSGPDNCAFDGDGRLWIATDGAAFTDFADGIWAMDVRGPGRALSRHFMRAPLGAEVSGLCFTPDHRTLFCSVQHPGMGKKSSFAAPSTRWPDFDPEMPPRPAVVAITRNDNGIIGS